jgi:hypothetical protein
MEHSPLEAYSRQSGQEIPPPFMAPEVPLSSSQNLATGSYSEPIESSPQPSTLFI